MDALITAVSSGITTQVTAILGNTAFQGTVVLLISISVGWGIYRRFF